MFATQHFRYSSQISTRKDRNCCRYKESFLHIAMDEDQRDFLRLIWYEIACSQNSTVKILRFARVVFGLTLSPFILNGTVRMHLQKYLRGEHIKGIIQKLIGDLYVDDVSSSLSN